MRYQHIIFPIILCASFFISATFEHIDFDKAMRFGLYTPADYVMRTEEELGMPADHVLDFFKRLYNKNSFILRSPHKNIPQVIHQIWIGSAVPEELKTFQESWQQIYPQWEYKLWTQNDIESFNFENIEYILQSRNPAEISDMMRYEILYRYGGVYVDMDQECLQSFDVLHEQFDFYVGIQPLDSGLVQLGIGVIGSVSGHPLLRACIDAIAQNWQQDKNRQAIPQRTGPILFTKVFLAYAESDGYINIALPTIYFYPLGCQEYVYDKNKWRHEGAIAVHYWAKTWLLPSFRRPEFKNINNH